MKSIALNALLTVFLVATGLAAYHRGVRLPAERIGMIDVAQVYRLKEKAFTEMVTKAQASDADKDKAIELAQAFALALPEALDELAQECNCLVLVRSAVAAPTPGMIDLTPALKHRLGL